MTRYRQRRLVAVCGVLIAVNGVLGLWFNIKTEPINRDIELDRQKIKVLKESLRELKLRYYQRTQLKQIQSYAIDQLDMTVPRHVHVHVIEGSEEKEP